MLVFTRDSHYYSREPKTPYKRSVISDYIRGVTVEFVVSSSVFSKDRIDPGTRVLIESLEVPREGLVLDVGCGYGVIGISIAKLNPKLKVYMVDINKRAVKLARENVVRNGVEDRVVVLEGDLYEPVKNLKFNAIVSNPPYAAGFKVVERLIRESINYLLVGGTLQIVARKGSEKVKRVMLETFRNVETIGRSRGYKVFKSYKVSI